MITHHWMATIGLAFSIFLYYFTYEYLRTYTEHSQKESQEKCVNKVTKRRHYSIKDQTEVWIYIKDINFETSSLCLGGQNITKPKGCFAKIVEYARYCGKTQLVNIFSNIPFSLISVR